MKNNSALFLDQQSHLNKFVTLTIFLCIKSLNLSIDALYLFLIFKVVSSLTFYAPQKYTAVLGVVTFVHSEEHWTRFNKNKHFCAVISIFDEFSE